MEFERTLYRVHERMISSPILKRFLLHCIWISTVFALVFFVALVFVDIKYREKSSCLLPEYEALRSEKYNNTEFPEDEYLNIQIVELPLATKINNLNNNFTNTTNLAIKQKWLEIEFTVNSHLMHLSNELRTSQNFTTRYIYIDSNCYATSPWKKIVINKLIGMDNVVINELLTIFQASNKPVVIKNPSSNDLLVFKPEFNRMMLSFKSLLDIVKLILKIMIGFFLLFNLTALYIRATIICAPIFILMVADSCLRNSNDINNRTSLYRTFPWVGAYLYALNFNNFNSNKHIFLAFLMFITFIYFLYLGSSAVWTFLLFNKPIPAGLNDNFYGFVALLEFASLLFIRTRSSLKYFPQLIFLIFSAFILYVNLTSYGFYFLFFSFAAQCCNIFLGLMLLCFEIPALLWSPSAHYTPTINKPRLLYFPLFSMSSISDAPQIWSMFYPLYDRSHFTDTQMSIIDRNYNLYRSALELAEARGDVDSDEINLFIDDDQRAEQNLNLNQARASDLNQPGSNLINNEGEIQISDINNNREN